MKTLATAALLAALTAAGFANGQEPGKPTEPAPAQKAAEGKLTVEGLRAMLEQMGYEAKPVKDGKTGEVYGYDITIQHSGLPVYCRLEVSKNGQVVWLYGTIARTADATTPAAVLLAMLAANNAISPASINYIPGERKFEVLLTLANDGVTPAKLRAALEQFARGIKAALDTFDKEAAKLKEQAAEKGGQ